VLDDELEAHAFPPTPWFQAEVGRIAVFEKDTRVPTAVRSGVEHVAVTGLNCRTLKVGDTLRVEANHHSALFVQVATKGGMLEPRRQQDEWVEDGVRSQGNEVAAGFFAVAVLDTRRDVAP